MPAYSNRYGNGEQPVYRQKMSDILSSGKFEIPQEIQDQIKYAASLGNKQGFSIVRGLGNALTSQSWYVCSKGGGHSYNFAPGCPAPAGFKEGGFRTLEQAIECFKNLGEQ